MADTKERDDPLDGLAAEAFLELGKEEGAGPHPTTAELVAYQEGQASEALRVRIRRHLANCGECAQLVLELAALDERAGEAPAPDEEVIDAGWEDFQQRAEGLDGSAGDPQQVSVEAKAAIPAAGRPPSGGQWWRQGLLAASLLLAGVMLGWWLPRPAGVGDAGEAAIRPYFFDLSPEASSQRRDVQWGERFEVPSDLDPLIARLNVSDQSRYEGYRVVALDAEGRQVWSLSALSRQPAGNFLVPLPRTVFVPGRFRLRLLGLRDGEEAELASYAFELDAQPAAQSDGQPGGSQR